jgi:hypothetical protein
VVSAAALAVAAAAPSLALQAVITNMPKIKASPTAIRSDAFTINYPPRL